MKIKNALFIAVILFFANSVLGQNNWNTDYENTLTKAKIEKKGVLLLFTGSDWCPPCKRLHSAIFESKEFEEYAKDNLFLIMADFPKRKKNKISAELKLHNEKLARKYGVRGFPTVLVLDTEGKVLDKSVGYSGISPEGYVKNIQELVKSVGLVSNH